MARQKRGTTSETDASSATESTQDPSQLQSNSDVKQSEDDNGESPDKASHSNNDGTGDSGAVIGQAGASGGPGVVSDNGASGENSGVQASDREPTRRDEPSTYGPANRASYLRKKARRVTLSDSDQAWLEEYEATKGRPGARKKKAAIDSAAGIPPTVMERGGSRAPRPPIVHETDNWRGKYKGGDSTGRELLCTLIGDQWHRMLVEMEKQLSEAGIAPIVEVSDQATRDLLILAVDDLVPSFVKATPAIVGAFKTTALTTQRIWKRKAIVEAYEKKKRAVRVLGSPPPLQSVPAPAPEPLPPSEPQGQTERETRLAEEMAASRPAPPLRMNAHGRVLPPDHLVR